MQTVVVVMSVILTDITLYLISTYVLRRFCEKLWEVQTNGNAREQ